MSAGEAVPAARRPALGGFERYLSVWVALCMVGGILLGHALTPALRRHRRRPRSHVNLPVAALIWLMIVPMLLKIDLSALGTGAGALARHRRELS